MSDHSSKRQRLTGSFSPASPPYHLAKTSDQTKAHVVHPNTPTSPPYVPMNSQPNGGFAMNATAASSEMTPPASVTMSQHVSQPVSSATNPLPFPTPASTAGVVSSTNLDSDGDAMMDDGPDGQDGDAVRLAEHRHSNHNRQRRDIFAADGTVKAARGICGSQLFSLCQNSHNVSRPHASQNLFELYNLDPLAKSVARTDPVTGEKINKLRKSYEGHIKTLQIAGKPKAVKMEGALIMPLSLPDFEFEVQRVSGKEIKQALSPEGNTLDQNFDSLLNSAFAGIAPGPIPPQEAQKYRAYLGTDEASKSKAGTEGLHRVMTPVAATPNASNPSAASRVSRPERAGAKRQYTDVSFQGYGEGFADDYGADSTGGEDNAQGGIAKKRRLGFERTSHQVEVGGVRR